MNLKPVADARMNSAVRISWPAVFMKAYAVVASQVPELRQTWYRWPMAHLYQHPCSVGILTVQREYKGAAWLFWGRIKQPENQPLCEIQAIIDQFTGGPPRREFRNEIRLAGLPTILRRMIWAWNIHVAKRLRAERLGTFFLSTLASKGVEIQVPPSIQTGCLTYGPLNDSGECRVTLAYDHRVMDGALAADCLRLLNVTLLETVRLELLKLASQNDTILEVA